MTTPYACICPARHDQPGRICGVNHPRCAALRLSGLWPLADDPPPVPAVPLPPEIGVAVTTAATNVCG